MEPKLYIDYYWKILKQFMIVCRSKNKDDLYHVIYFYIGLDEKCGH